MQRKKAHQILCGRENAMEGSRMERGESDYSFLHESEQMEEELRGCWHREGENGFGTELLNSNANSCQGRENDSE